MRLFPPDQSSIRVFCRLTGLSVLGAALLCGGAAAQVAAPQTPVGQTSVTLTASVTLAQAGSPASVAVLSKGAPNLDFQKVGDNCVGGTFAAGQFCLVQYTFTPKSAGVRLGGIVVKDGAGNALGTAYVAGVGVAPLGLFSAPTANWTVGGLNTPRGVSVDGFGNVYVADTNNDRVVKIPAGGGAPIPLASMQNFDGGATAVDGAGNVYASSNYRSNAGTTNGVYELINGSFIRIATLPDNFPDDNLSVDGAGNLYTSDSSGGIYRIAAGTHQVTTLMPGGFGRRFIGLAVDPAGNIFAADFNSSTLFELPVGGGLTALVAGGALDNPHSVVLDPAGNIYVGNLSGASNILRFAAGSLRLTILPADGTASLAMDGQGNIYAVNGNSVVLYSRGSGPSIALPTVQYGGSSGATVQVEFENDGNADLVVSSYAGSPANFGTSGSGNTCAVGTLSSGATCLIVPSFTPTAVGTLSGAVTLTDNNLGQVNAQQSVGVSGAATPAPLTVTASSPTAFAGEVPVVTASYSGFVFSDSAFSLTTAPTCTTSQTAATPAGTAFVTSCSGGAAANYTFHYVNGGGTVLPQSSVSASPTTGVGQSGGTQTAFVNFTTSGTLGSVAVVTGGFQDLDFAAAGTVANACAVGQAYQAGDACAVAYAFTPRTAGPRLGAILLRDTNGNLLGTTFLSGTGTGAIAAYTGAAAVSYPTPGQNAVVQVGMDAQGNVYYGNNSGGLSELKANGDGTYAAASTVIPSGFPINNFLHAGGFDGAGNLYLGDNGHSVVYRVPVANGVPSASFQTVTGFGGDHPQALAADTAGNVYVAACCSGNLYRIAPGATTATFMLTLPDTDPEGMVIDAAGNLYLGGASNSNALVEVANPASAHPTVSTIPVGVGSPFGLGMDANGDLYFSDQRTGQSTVYRIANVGGALHFATPTLVASGINVAREILFDSLGNMVTTLSGGGIEVFPQQHPNPQVYPQTNVGSASASQSQALTNLGNADLSFAAVAFDFNFPNQGSTCGLASLAPAATCAFTTVFAPSVSGSPVHGSLTISDNAVNETSAQTVAQSGTALHQPQSISFSLASPVTYGVAPFPLTASATSGLPVTFTLSAGAPAILNGNYLTVTGIGTFTVTASQPGDAAFLAATPVTQSLTVNPAPQTITFPAPTSPALVNSSATLTASASSGATVTYTVTSGSGSIAGSSITYTNAGSVVITASAPAFGNFAAAAPVAQTVQVNPEPLSYAAANTNVGQAAGPVTAFVNFTAAGTLGAINIVTQGAANLDFSAASTSSVNACQVGQAYTAGQACEADFTFSPQSAGTREGGIVLTDASGNVLGTSYLGGVGVAPLGLFSSPVATRTASSGISVPRGLSVDGSGNIYFANTGDNTLREIPANTSTVQILLSTPISSGATAVDGAGNLYLASASQNAVFQVVRGGLVRVASRITPDDNLEVDGAGNLYTSNINTGAIYKIDVGTHQVHTLLAGGQNHRFIGLAVDPAGDIFAPDFINNILYELPAGANSLITLASGLPLSQPHSIALDPAGNIYVGNLNGAGIMRYAAGTFQETTLPADGTKTIAVDGLGNIYAAVNDTSIAVYARNTSPTITFPSTQFGQTSGAPKVEFENDGNAGLAVSTYAASANFGSAGAGNTCATGTLASGATCVISATFTPAVTGSLTGALTLTDNNLNQSDAQQSINLVGTATAAPITVTASSRTITFGQPNPTITGAVTSGALVGGDTLASIGITCSVDGTPGNAGTYATSCSGTPANYTVTFVSGKLTIQQASLTVTAASPTITFGQPHPAITGAVTSGALVGSDTLASIGITCSITGSAVNAGTYPTACSGSPANYAVSFVGGTLTVNQAPLTVTAASPSVTFGQPNPAITGAVTGGALVGSDTLSSIGIACSITGAAFNAGTYPTSCAGSPANYAVTFVGGTLTINQAPLTVAASSPSITFGQPNPAITGAVTSGALVGSDTLASIGVSCSVGGSPVNAGTYPTACAGSPANYAVTFVGGTLTILQAPITVTASSASIVYGQPNPAVLGSVTAGALVGSDSVASIGVSCAVVGSPINVGGYPTACAGSPANYAVTFVGGTLTITPAPLTITGNSFTRFYNTPNPAFTGTILGIQHGDALSALYTTTADQASNVGTYPIAITPQGAALGNYTVTLVPGTLTIIPAPQTITFATIGDQVFNGVPFSLTLNAVASSGLPVAYSVTGAALNGTSITISAPGAVTVVASQPGNSNYQPATAVSQTFQARLGLAYGLYATSAACQSLSFRGHVRVDSFDGSLGAFPAGLLASGGNVGTNGTLTLAGDAAIYGALFDPHGNTRDDDCDSSHPASLVAHGRQANLAGGIIGLPAALVYPTPAAPAVAPPTTEYRIGSSRQPVNLAPGTYGNLVVSGRVTVNLSAGTYNLNSLRLDGGATLNIASGPVTINLAGQALRDDALDAKDGVIVNGLGPNNLAILYGGRYDIELSGGRNGDGDHGDGDHDRDDAPVAGLQAIVYAPNARVKLSGGTVLSGTIVGYTITSDGDVAIHYDRSLAGTAAFSGGTPPPPCAAGDRDRDDRNACSDAGNSGGN